MFDFDSLIPGLSDILNTPGGAVSTKQIMPTVTGAPITIGPISGPVIGAGVASEGISLGGASVGMSSLLFIVGGIIMMGLLLRRR